MPGNDSYTKLLILSDTTDNSTTFVDSSASEHTVTAHGDVHHDTDNYVFGTSSIKFDGTGDYLSIPTSTDFDFGTGDFTIDLRVKLTGALGRTLIKRALPGGYGWHLAAAPGDSNTYYFAYYSDLGTSDPNGYVSISFSYDIGASSDWHHIAVVRNGTSFKVYINGTVRGSATSSVGAFTGGYVSGGSPPPNYDVEIGYSIEGYSLTGYLDQIRISKGIARWTADFTPSTEPYDELNRGYGEINTPAPSLEATGTFPTFGFCEFNTPAPWVDGIGNNPILGYGEFNTPVPVITAAEMSLGYGEFNTPAVALSATGSFPIFVWANLYTPRVSLDSTGTSQTLGFCEFNAPRAVLSAESGGDVRMQTTAVSLDSAGVMAYPGFGELNTPRVVLSSYGVQNLLATVSMTPPRVKLKAFSSIPSGYTVVKYRR